MSARFEHARQNAVKRAASLAPDVASAPERMFSPTVREAPVAPPHSTARAIQRSSVLQRQQVRGNAFVQRMIASSTIMRCACAPGEACSCGHGGADAERDTK